METRVSAEYDVGETGQPNHRWSLDRGLMAFLRSLSPLIHGMPIATQKA